MRKYLSSIFFLLLTCYVTNGLSQDKKWEFEGRNFQKKSNTWVEEGLSVTCTGKKPLETDVCVWKKEKWDQWYDAADRVTREIMDRDSAVIFFASPGSKKIRRVFRSQAHLDEAIERGEVVVLVASLIPPGPSEGLKEDDDKEDDDKKDDKIIWLAVGGGLVAGVLITNLIDDDSEASAVKK